MYKVKYFVSQNVKYTLLRKQCEIFGVPPNVK